MLCSLSQFTHSTLWEQGFLDTIPSTRRVVRREMWNALANLSEHNVVTALVGEVTNCLADTCA